MCVAPEGLALHTTLEPRGPAGALVLTDEQVAAIGGGAKALPVRVTVNGRTVAARLTRMRGESLIGFSKTLRAEAGVDIGDELDVVIARDEGPREAGVPPALAAALAADAAASERFAAVAPSHRKEFARWVAEAKREETRARRVAEVIEMLREGRTR